MSDMSLMPLVDEVHRLRNENRVLRSQMEEQAVRIDEMLAGAHLPRSYLCLNAVVRFEDVLAAGQDKGAIAKQVAGDFARQIIKELMFGKLAVSMTAKDTETAFTAFLMRTA